MKTLHKIFGIALAALLVGGIFSTTNAQANKELQYFRPYDQDGVNMFEATKADKDYDYDGFQLFWGGAFTQQFQSLSHSTSGVDANGAPIQLGKIGSGFNLATANLYLDAQLADGIRVDLQTYLSSRHHSEAWVKGGYLRVDALPMLHSEAIDNLMKVLTVKAGHFEINYGDTHFRRTDNAFGLHNPFVGNYLMDSFTTEVGGEVYAFSKGFIGMIGLTSGQLHPTVVDPQNSTASVYGKVGYDKKMGDDMRFRLTGSVYHNNHKTHLYHGDRGGSRYYDVLDAGAWSGRIEPGFSNGFTSVMINPFVKLSGLELFGVIESSNEMKTDKSVSQFAIDGKYYLSDAVYVGGRYNTVSGDLSGAASNASVNRVQIGAGWFMTKSVLVKGEYVTQKYNDYQSASIYNGAKFDGLMIEGSIAF